MGNSLENPEIMMKPKRESSSPLSEKPGQPTNRRFYIFAATILVITVVGVIQSTAQLFLSNNTWQFYTNLAINILGLVVSLAALFLVQRGRVVNAGGLLIIYVILYSLSITLLFTGLGLMMQLMVTMAGIIISLEMLTGRKRSIAIICTLMAGILSFGTDLLPSLWRISTPSSNFNIIISICFVVLVGIYILYNFKHYSLQIRLIFIFLGVNLFAVFLIAASAYYLTRITLLNNSNQKLISTAKSLSSEIQEFIDFNLNEILVQTRTPSLAGFLTFTPEQRTGSLVEIQTKKLLNDWQQQNPEYIESYAILDRSGIDILDTETGSHGLDESKGIYFLEAVTSGLPTTSPIVISATGGRVWFFSAPIIDVDNNILGVLRLRYRADVLQVLVTPYNDRSGDDSFGVLMDEYNIVLAHGLNPGVAQWVLTGLPEVEVRQLQMENRLGEIIKWLDLPFLREKLAKAKPDEIIESDMPLTGAVRPGSGAIATLGNKVWKVFFFQPRDAIFKPIEGQTEYVILFAEIAALIVISLSNLATRVFTNPIQRVTRVAEEFSHGNFTARIDVNSSDEIGALSNTLNNLASRMDATLQNLEYRVQERTRSIEVSAEIGRKLSGLLNTRELVQEVVNQLKTAFNYYHVHIYLLDSSRQNLDLVGGTGSVSEIMLAQGYKIPLGRGLVGRAALRGSYVIVSDTSKEPGWLPNPLLPETRSELAVPILFGDQVQGVLDVQQDRADGFTERDIDTIQLISSQVAIALRNSRLLDSVNQRAKNQAQLTKIIDEINSTVDVERALKVAAREVGRATGGSNTVIRVKNRVAGNT